LITNKIATLQEINEHWTYEDILKGNAMLDMQEDIKNYYNEKASKKRG